MTYLVVIAVVVVLALSVVAGYLHWQLYKVNLAKDKAKAEQKQALEENRRRSLNSIIVIARAMLEDQVTLTEASMRISVLLTVLQLPQEEVDQYVAFSKLAQATSHIPILDAWKALSRNDKQRLDQERENHEAKYRDFVISAAQRLLTKREEYHSHISGLAAG